MEKIINLIGFITFTIIAIVTAIGGFKNNSLWLFTAFSAAIAAGTLFDKDNNGESLYDFIIHNK